jgi:hypothetical protein
MVVAVHQEWRFSANLDRTGGDQETEGSGGPAGHAPLLRGGRGAGLAEMIRESPPRESSSGE